MKHDNIVNINLILQRIEVLTSTISFNLKLLLVLEEANTKT